jgi:hypothetical protein
MAIDGGGDEDGRGTKRKSRDEDKRDKVRSGSGIDATRKQARLGSLDRTGDEVRGTKRKDRDECWIANARRLARRRWLVKTSATYSRASRRSRVSTRTQSTSRLESVGSSHWARASATWSTSGGWPAVEPLAMSNSRHVPARMRTVASTVAGRAFERPPLPPHSRMNAQGSQHGGHGIGGTAQPFVRQSPPGASSGREFSRTCLESSTRRPCMHETFTTSDQPTLTRRSVAVPVRGSREASSFFLAGPSCHVCLVLCRARSRASSRDLHEHRRASRLRVRARGGAP